MKRLLPLLLALVLALSAAVPAYATGDGNFDGGGGSMGDGTKTNYWNPGMDGVRVSVIHADSQAVTGTVFDLTNKVPSTGLAHFGKVSKLSYNTGKSIAPKAGNYTYINPSQSLPKIISTSSSKASIAAIRSYFTDEQVIRSIAGYAGMDFDTLIGGDYKLIVEPLAYLCYNGQQFAMTATEAALYDQIVNGDLRKKLGTLTHKNLPLAIFLEEADLGYAAWSGSRTDKVSNGDIISSLGSERVILHSDMNSFYASVEMMLDPELKGKPVAVCGSTEERHGIVLAKSDLAKKAGVKTGMVNWEARQLCPGLIVVPPQYDQYLKYSKLARQIYHRYTDLIEPYGMDECWLDVTGSRTCGTGMEIAEAIRQTTKDELGLTVSIGVSFNKIFAKLGSDMKKPDAITEIRQDNFKERIWPLDAAELLYVGRSTENKLAQYGIRTIGDVAKASPETLQHMLGINGIKLWRYANGTDTSRVMHKDFVSPVKSIGHGITCTADLQTPEEVFRVMLELSQDVGHRLRVHELMACGVQVSVRANDLYGSQYQCKLPFRTQLPSEIARAGFRLFMERYRWDKPIRAVTIRGIDLVSQKEAEQLSMFVDHQKRDRRIRLEDAVEDIRKRFGKRAISYAVLMGDLKIPDDGRQLVTMPGLMYQ